jgi:transaldolase
MKIYLDTADVSEVQKHFATGLIDGVTTNPTLIMKSGRQPRDVYRELKLMGVEDISMEIVGDAPYIVAEAHKLVREFEEVCTIKVPCTREGLLACRELSKEGIRTNVTLVFSAAQAILAAKSGATYVSPFVGRCDDNSVAGLEVVRSIAEVYGRQRVDTQVLAASIRDVYKVTRAFYNGASIVTVPPSIFEKMYNHVLTDAGLLQFDKDWRSFS